MNHSNYRHLKRVLFLPLLATWVLLSIPTAMAFTLSVTGPDGESVSGFRWLVQRDTTIEHTPGVINTNSLSMRFHTSYIPVVASGVSTGASTVVSVPDDERYFVSVLPDSGYAIGGASIARGQSTATATVNALPLPTAQISVFVFEDKEPINGAPDLPEEQGLAGFKIVLYDAGGRYGMSGGQMMSDAFGNMLGTVYDENGDILQVGTGVVFSDENGLAIIKNLPQGKYGVQVVPPAGEGWNQTSTIEGSKTIDAWVKPNEPQFFVEFGPPSWHTFFGFTKETNDVSVLDGTGSISGQVVVRHSARPPDFTVYGGAPFPGAWVSLNDASGKGIYTGPCDENSQFSITNVPAGIYQLVVWDENLDILIDLSSVAVGDGENVALGEVPVFGWFGRLENHVFNDLNENGFRDPGEPPIPGQAINLRFRDGTVYQSVPTDGEGFVPFEEVFPFFHWLTAEVDFARFKPTGVTIVTDEGGAVLPDNGWDYPSRGILTPQPQFEADGITPSINPNTSNNLARTETGPVLTEAFQLFAGQTTVMEWGKSTYDRVDTDNAPFGNFPGVEDVDQNGNGEFDSDNGGIAGIIYYSTTRAEEDPRFAVGEPWEPGVPRVQVNLYADFDNDREIDDLDGDLAVTLADVDNYPFGNFPGAEDIDRNTNTVFDLGDAMNVTTSDSWDDNLPENAQGEVNAAPHGATPDAFDGLPNYNQTLSGLFDGGYAFSSYMDDGVEIPYLPTGTYIIEAVAPPGYEYVKEEDKNVDFGDEYDPAPFLLPPISVGDDHLVPAELTLFPGIAAPFAGELRPLPDRKQVLLQSGKNAACDFFLFTPVPVCAQIVGIIGNDLANEFNPVSPVFGEKYTPPWVPISIRDWTGREIARTYSDEFGAYNALVPSTYTANVPHPSGVSPNMLTVRLNDPGPILDTDTNSATFGQMIQDPYFNRSYSQFPYTLQYMPGTVTYLDTPVLPTAAFVGQGQFPLDCEVPDGTPVVSLVHGSVLAPYVSSPGQTISILSAGLREVLNPLYGSTNSEPRTIIRDYGFGNSPGTVTLGGVPLTNISWNNTYITATVPAGAQTGQLTVRASCGLESPLGVTVTVGPIEGTVRMVSPSTNSVDTPIQDAIDLADPGDLILVTAGTYTEPVVMWKPVQLQGSGAFSTIIDSVKTPAESVAAWQEKVESLVQSGLIDLLPGQTINILGGAPELFPLDGSAGISVFGSNVSQGDGGFGESPRARIDGLTVMGSDQAGGIFANGYCRYLEIGNNLISGNQGASGGGIIIGHPALLSHDNTQYEHSRNDHIRIHHNLVTENSSFGDIGFSAIGGGISLYTGSDHYEVTDNIICGNLSLSQGGGICHSGLIEGGVIANNKIMFNQVMNQMNVSSGGGIYIGGKPPTENNNLTAGAGSVSIFNNTIQGNQAASGNGGGIALNHINGKDVSANPNSPDAWYAVTLFNNCIINNVAGLAGGGISLQNAARVHIINNVISHNDSTATADAALQAGAQNESQQQPAGIVSRAHTLDLQNAFGTAPEVIPFAEYSNPELLNNIIWQNRSFYFFVDELADPAYGLRPDPSTPDYYDLGVLGTLGPEILSPQSGILTDTTGYDPSNVSADPLFAASYFNGAPDYSLVSLGLFPVAVAFDEGGNMIDVRFGPLTPINPLTGGPYADCHVAHNSPAIDIASTLPILQHQGLENDFDGELRPNRNTDAGADEVYAAGTTNSSPNAFDDQYTITGTNGIFQLPAPGILLNDIDANQDGLSAVPLSAPSNGVLYADGSLDYTPSLGFTGTVVFTYKATDGMDFSHSATVTVRVAESDADHAPPIAVNDVYEMLTNTTLSVSASGVLANDSDPDGDTFSAVLASGVSNGVLSLEPNGAFTYTPSNNFTGLDVFNYTPVDGSTGNVGVVTISVDSAPVPGNQPPVPSANDLLTSVLSTGQTRVVANDPDLYDQHTFSITTPPANGTATITGTGILSYTPTGLYFGPDSLVVTVWDQAGANGSVVVGIEVSQSIYQSSDTPAFLQCPPDLDGIDTDGDGNVSNDHVCVNISAGDGFIKLADGNDAYIFGFHGQAGVPENDIFTDGQMAAEFPAPTIVVKEGQKLYLNLSNVGMMLRPDLFDPHTVHWHGFPEASAVFDGVPDSSIAVNMRATLTYFYNIVEPGTFMYHCHVEATEHMQMGMLGNLYVMPIQNNLPAGTNLNGFVHQTGYKYAYNDGDGSTYYDVEYPLQISGFDFSFHEEDRTVQPLSFALIEDDYPMLNGRGYPDTVNTNAIINKDGLPSQGVNSLIEAQQGDKILLRVSSLSTVDFTTLTVLGIPMEVVGRGARLLRGPDPDGAGPLVGKNNYIKTSSITVGGGDAYDVILDTANVPIGTYFLYTSNLNRLSNGPEDFGGIMTEIRIQ